MTYKSAREGLRYTRQGNDDMESVRHLVREAFQKGVDMGYHPHEIFYEIGAEAQMEFLMVAVAPSKHKVVE